MVTDDRGIFLLFSTLQNKGWSVVSVQNNFFSSPSNRQSVVTRAQSKLDEGAFLVDAVASIRNSRYKSWMLKTIYRTYKESARATFVEAY